MRATPAWLALEQALLLKRDRMVAQMVQDRPKAEEHPGISLARKERALGYIEAMNAIVKLPVDAQEKARKASIGE